MKRLMLMAVYVAVLFGAKTGGQALPHTGPPPPSREAGAPTVQQAIDIVKPAAAETKVPPQVPDDAKNMYAQLQVRDAGLAEAMAILQKERDSVNAERARLVQRLIAAQPDYDLAQAGALAVAYVQKKPK